MTDFSGGFNNDPYLSDNSTNEWNTDGQNNGLRLTIVNALDDDWQVEFQSAVYDWENGDPDALTLTTSKVDVDSSCSPINGVMKVCNGNYGETGWLGINGIITTQRTGIIQNSVAKMNEYYLSNAGDAERQYTMCHEIGHGFGLPHTDENFDNADLGNCLDYTRNPENNLHPDDSNFARLVSLYGRVVTTSGRRLLLRGSAGAGSNMDDMDMNMDMDMDIAAPRIPADEEDSTSTPLNPRLLSAYQKAMVDLEQDMFTTDHHYAGEQSPSSSGWRLLESHRRGRKFERNLGEGFMLHVSVLHPLR